MKKVIISRYIDVFIYFTFIRFVGMDRAMLPLVIKLLLALSNFTFIEASSSWIFIIIQYYNLLIYFQSAYLVGGGDKFASPYMASRQPLLVTILKLVTLKDSNQTITSIVIL